MKDELTEGQWQRLLPLLPMQRSARGRPAKDHRTVVNAVLWILRTGAPWRDLPSDAGVCWKTAASRFYRWNTSGVWQKILAELQRDADQDGEIDWSLGTSSMVALSALTSTLQALEVAASKTKRSVEVVEASPARSTSKPKGMASF